MKFTSSPMVMCHVTFPIVHKNISINMGYQIVVYLNDDGGLSIDEPEFTDCMDLQVDGGTIVEAYKEIDNFFNVMLSLGHDYKTEICEGIEKFIKESDPRIFMTDISNLLIKNQ